MITFLWALLLVITVLAGLSIALVLRDGGTAPRFAVSIVCLAAFAVALSVFVDPPDHTGKVALATFVLTSATLGGWPVTASVLRWTLPTTASQPSSLPATGWIGIAERFGFTLALILGLPEVAALVVGVKALGIYAAPSSATTNVTASARVLGSLTSVGWALLVCAAYLVASR